ncbi:MULTISPECIES: hypothetical protein [Pseudomonas]|uniref:Uncharacterized protein n=1 Tax=Pseudomonas taiwanensis TaxID=470150 RepID=A0ABR6VEJ9_9PSED|nr:MULTISPECIES: hypothetical protein [Pseudomonas]AVD88654.1 hypothetical protein C4Q26_16560 [Pseudomonas sp. SWI44]MBC3478935.1 hypothetical protein [Pseudomonas taiwanensis]MBC3490848.1 hypothetical protein [Pseudomonas taiwanensis]MDT8922636.1 hypothetical protein [Pseudomonas taiwanensis]QQZ35487.1 hypothetical protein IF103_20010 [Pseudomonas sp. SK2]
MNILIKLPSFFSNLDEVRFFEGITSNPAIVDIRGTGKGLSIKIDRRKLSKENARELISILFRYGVNLTPLAAIANGNRHAWIKDSDYYWHESMFANKQSGDFMDKHKGKTGSVMLMKNMKCKG